MTEAPTPSGPGVHRSNLPDLAVLLKEGYAGQLKRRDDLKAKLSSIPAVIEDDEQLAAARAAVVDTNTLLGEAKKAHEAEKAPYLKGGRDVDTFFNTGIRDELSPLKVQVSDRVAAYLEKQRREREAAAAAEAERERQAAAKLAAEAAELEEQGRVREADAKMEAAVGAEGAAAAAESFTTRSVADQSRVSLSGGGTASVRTVKAFRNLNRQQLDLESLRPFFKQEHLEAAITAFMRTGQTSLKGVEIYDAPKATIR